MSGAQQVDAVVVGAGFAGLYMLKRLRERGLNSVLLERGAGVGGTWYWNRYPGAKCDVESPFYSMSFDDPALDQEWEWSTRYPDQAELMSFMNHVADRFNLREDIRLESSVESATFDESSNTWSVTYRGPDGEKTLESRFFILATGCLSVPNVPKFEGLENFKGSVYHTGDWPHEEVDFTGLRVGVIGTGSSGVQLIPEVAKEASELKVFQRTANYSVPANNGPLTAEKLAKVKEEFPEIREKMRNTGTGMPTPDPTELVSNTPDEVVRKVFEDHWTLGSFAIQNTFADLAINQESNDKLAHFIHEKIDGIVEDPEVAEKLKAREYPVGSKRICVDSNYYETFNRSNVELVDVKSDPITSITETGVATQNKEYELDALVLATGFDAMTGAIMNIDIQGRDGKRIQEYWDAGPLTYLGLSVAGFPNMFSLAGPGSPSVLTNVVAAIEQHVEWVDEHIGYLDEHDFATSEAHPDYEREWVDHVNEIANMTLFLKGASWYLGANVPGKPRVFMPYAGGLKAYRDRCEEIAANGYEGFQLVKRDANAMSLSGAR
ncbi:flavin-containing monooxygenase [Gulosibacter chungangensis]|uniref:NAD(P)/FAD-dependent oxidoreductase n=1 Tax=Gulosibacter chungangensis TaxID=979746 RepID=A0A7J5BFR0_9MICO|nr:NAD(P)/FAD-dependent oxidoreductase [Gulosibacter chungangensis]KAB1645113.1 NAD(P)/FAD-dependent oxidoreductase [Gulosibacter chungangensis]